MVVVDVGLKTTVLLPSATLIVSPGPSVLLLNKEHSQNIGGQYYLFAGVCPAVLIPVTNPKAVVGGEPVPNTPNTPVNPGNPNDLSRPKILANRKILASQTTQATQVIPIPISQLVPQIPIYQNLQTCSNAMAMVR
jgi:hypothetical protein